jgi:hypothetical protein
MSLHLEGFLKLASQNQLDPSPPGISPPWLLGSLVPGHPSFCPGRLSLSLEHAGVR